MSNRAFSLLKLLFYLAGSAIAFRLGSLQKLEMFKVLNIVGIIYGLVGVAVLSEFITQNKKWSRFVVEKLSGLIIWAHGTIPLGAAVTSLILFFVARNQFPSALAIGPAFLGFALYALLPTFFVEHFVFSPKSARFTDPILRTRIFGLFLVITGMVAQLVAAIQDVLNT